MAFAQKRKTLANNLRAAAFSPEVVTAALANAQIPAQARAEAMGIENFAILWHKIRELVPPSDTPSNS